MATTSTDRIVKTPGTCGGKARIAGHRIRVMDVVAWHEHQGMSPKEIVAEYPSLMLSDVHIALAYYFDNIEDIRAEMQRDADMAEAFRRDNPSILEARLKQLSLDEAS